MAKARTGADSIETAERDHQIMEMRRRGRTLPSIADHFGLSKQRVHAIITRMLAAIPAEGVQHYRAEQLERLDALLETAYGVLDAQHLKFHDGMALTHDGIPVTDSAPVLAAVVAILRIEERRARLLGLDAPVKQEVTAGVTLRYELAGLDEL